MYLENRQYARPGRGIGPTLTLGYGSRYDWKLSIMHQDFRGDVALPTAIPSQSSVDIPTPVPES